MLTRQQAEALIKEKMEMVYRRILSEDSDLFINNVQKSAFGRRLGLSQTNPDLASRQFETLIENPNSLLYDIIKFN